MRKFLMAAAGCVVLFSAAASAHVVAVPDTGQAGAYFETAFRVSHGCDGSDTASVTVTLPEDIVMARPQPKAGWTVEIKTSKLDKPASLGHGKTTDVRVDRIVWSGGSLPDDQFDTFAILFKMPDQAGGKLWFPVKQVCVKGEKNWADIPKAGQEWHDVETPAPFITVEPVPLSMAAHHH